MAFVLVSGNDSVGSFEDWQGVEGGGPRAFICRKLVIIEVLMERLVLDTPYLTSAKIMKSNVPLLEFTSFRDVAVEATYYHGSDCFKILAAGMSKYTVMLGDCFNRVESP